MAVVGLAAQQTRGRSLVYCDSHALSQPIWLSATLAGKMPDPVASALTVVWPQDSFGVYPMDRACVRWDVLPGVSPEALDVAGRSARADMAAIIPRLKKIFMKEGVPQQWVWVAQVESALNPRAKSSAGAVGLFQLMPGTARRFGLQTAPVDDRMEPEKSAGAAAQYLKFLHQEFGCWSLALAAYNAGEGRVKEIMKRHKARTFEEVGEFGACIPEGPGERDRREVEGPCRPDPGIRCHEVLFRLADVGAVRKDI